LREFVIVRHIVNGEGEGKWRDLPAKRTKEQQANMKEIGDGAMAKAMRQKVIERHRSKSSPDCKTDGIML